MENPVQDALIIGYNPIAQGLLEELQSMAHFHGKNITEKDVNLKLCISIVRAFIVDTADEGLFRMLKIGRIDRVAAVIEDHFKLKIIIDTLWSRSAGPNTATITPRAIQGHELVKTYFTKDELYGICKRCKINSMSLIRNVLHDAFLLHVEGDATRLLADVEAIIDEISLVILSIVQHHDDLPVKVSRYIDSVLSFVDHTSAISNLRVHLQPLLGDNPYTQWNVDLSMPCTAIIRNDGDFRIAEWTHDHFATGNYIP